MTDLTGVGVFLAGQRMFVLFNNSLLLKEIGIISFGEAASGPGYLDKNQILSCLYLSGILF